MIRGSACSKSRLAKAAGAEVVVQQRTEKLHAAVVRSAFVSQNVKSMRCSDHFFEVQMSKNSTPLWREAHLQIKMCKTPPGRTTFLRFRCQKMPCGCGAKHLQVKIRKTLAFWQTLELTLLSESPIFDKMDT